MAKYSSFKYSAAKYGAGEQDANFRWTFIVAWDGYYSWGNEANKMTSLHVKRGRETMVGSNGFLPYKPGEASAIFDNSDGRYDPWNSSSPLYPNVKPGKFVRIAVLDDANDNNYEIMRGIITNVIPVVYDNVPHVRIEVRDGLWWLANKTVNIGLQSGSTKSVITGKIYTAADWPSEEWSSSVGGTGYLDTTIYWWAWKQNALEALQEFNAGELATSFHSREGILRWRSKAYEAFRTRTVLEAEILSDIAIAQPWESKRDDITIVSHPKHLDPINAIIWQLQDVPSIADGAEFYVEALFKYEEWQPCGSSITFNHTINAQADGGGADLTANCPLTYNPDIGEGAEIIITNNSGSTGYVTLLKATGDAIYARSPAFLKANNSLGDWAYFSSTSMTIDSRWQESTLLAQAIANWLKDELEDPSPAPTIQFENEITNQFGLDLHDKVVLTVGKFGITTQNFRVGSIEHQTIGEGCQGVRTTMHLEPYFFYS